MAKQRIKKKLTSKKAFRIALFICTLLIIAFTVLYILRYNIIDADMRIMLPFCCILLTFALGTLVYECLLHGSDLRRQEREEKELTDLKENLSQEFKRVYLIFDESDFNAMIKQILQNEECKFYAKFAENNNIVIIAKDKYGNEVYRGEVENPIYFNYHFKFEE